MQPSPGRIVHYVLMFGEHSGHKRPAIITRVNDKDVDLTVFLCADDEGAECPIRRAPYSEAGDPGTWHWPKKQEE